MLRGTLVTGEPSGYAILEPGDGSGTQRWVRTGEQIMSGTVLDAVYPDHAILRHGGRRLRIDFGNLLAEAVASPQPVRNIELARVPELMSALDIIPHQQDDRIVGYYANHIPRHLRDEVGLHPGDLLRRINGIPLDGTLDPDRLFDILRTGSIELLVERQGRPLVLRYRLLGSDSVPASPSS